MLGFAFMISLTVVPLRSAMAPNVSPDFTVYRACAPEGLAGEVDGLGAGEEFAGGCAGGGAAGGGAAGGVPATGGCAENATGEGGGVPAIGPGGGM